VLATNTRAPSVVDDLLALATQSSAPMRPVLILTEEKTVVEVSKARTRLAPHYRFILSPEPLLSDLQSKAGFQKLAATVDAPVPRGVVLQSSSDLEAIDQLVYPCVLKPLEQDAAYGERFKKAYKVPSPDAAKALYREIEPVMSRMIVQEWLEGADSDIYFCLGFWDERSRLVGEAFVGRKLRSWPLQVGGTASCTSAPEAAMELTRLTDAFVKATGFVGQMGMEFKRDTKRGGFYMIEPTVGRTDYQHEIATLAGTNILAMMVAHLAEQAIPSSGLTRQVIWYDEVADALALAAGAPDDGLTGHRRVAAVWRLEDPMPTLVSLRRRLLQKLKSLAP
jgi:predicted ATP-grasp superfamily ATP-dependent carboligase